MGRKCSVYGCRSGYKSQKDLDYIGTSANGNKVKFFRFPKDHEQRKKWIRALPNKLQLDDITDNMTVCSKHFPADVEKRKHQNHWIPIEPPTLCLIKETSCCSTPQPKPRQTQNSASDSRRSIDPEKELKTFLDSQKLKLDSFCYKLRQELQHYSAFLVWGLDNKSFSVISVGRTGPVYNFSIHCEVKTLSDNCIKELNYEAYSALKRIRPKCLHRDIVTCWEHIQILLKTVCDPGDQEDKDSDKFDFLSRQICLLNANKNARLYSNSDLCQAFSWYASSRALYCTMRDYLQLPSLPSLRMLTRKAKNIQDVTLFADFLTHQDERSRGLILIFDEVYVKAGLTYKGGEVFGYAHDEPGKCATTLLAIMAKCFFTSSTFLVKLIPLHALTAQKAFTYLTEAISTIESCGGRVFTLICDNNRVNQATFRMFTPINSDEPYIVHNPSSQDRPLFLMYDPVHLLKNIRNNWITEKMQTLKFTGKEHQEKSATWEPLRVLNKHETAISSSNSRLTKASIDPSSLERQKVSLVLNVFCDHTLAALRTSEVTHACPEAKDCAELIGHVLQLWKVLNCKSKFATKTHNDGDRVVIDASEAGERGLALLQRWAEYKILPKPAPGVRKQTLTHDTSSAISWTCRSLIAISHYLLGTDSIFKHEYVCLGFFQQDDLEKHFGRFRMAAGCNFFVTTRDVFAKHNMDRAQMMLRHCEGDNAFSTASFHMCQVCSDPLSEEENSLLDALPELVTNVCHDDKLALFYISGYVASKNPLLKGNKEEFIDDVTEFLDEMDRGKLSYPCLELFEFALLAFVFFTQTPEKLCRVRFVRIVGDFTSHYQLNITLQKDPLMRLANIFFKRFCINRLQTSHVSAKRTIAKLSSKTVKVKQQ